MCFLSGQDIEIIFGELENINFIMVYIQKLQDFSFIFIRKEIYPHKYLLPPF